MSRVLLLVDVSNQVYKASAVHPTLSSEDRFTGGLFGFLVALSKAILYSGATQLVLCYDHKPYRRSAVYPEYKSIRATTRDEDLTARAKETMQYVEDLVQTLGLAVWSIPGFESDDLIGYAAKKYRHRYAKIVAASNDSDLFQLFQYESFSLWRGKDKLYGRKEYDKDWKVSPEKIPTLLAMTGTHNEIAGIQGVGDVTATKAILDPALYRKLRQTHATLIDRNISLIQLPHPEFPHDTPIPRSTKSYRGDRTLLHFCGRFDINTTKAMLDAFNQLKN